MRDVDEENWKYFVIRNRYVKKKNKFKEEENYI